MRPIVVNVTPPSSDNTCSDNTKARELLSSIREQREHFLKTLTITKQTRNEEATPEEREDNATKSNCSAGTRQPLSPRKCMESQQQKSVRELVESLRLHREDIEKRFRSSTLSSPSSSPPRQAVQGSMRCGSLEASSSDDRENKSITQEPDRHIRSKLISAFSNSKKKIDGSNELTRVDTIRIQAAARDISSESNKTLGNKRRNTIESGFISADAASLIKSKPTPTFSSGNKRRITIGSELTRDSSNSLLKSTKRGHVDIESGNTSKKPSDVFSLGKAFDNKSLKHSGIKSAVSYRKKFFDAHASEKIFSVTALPEAKKMNPNPNKSPDNDDIARPRANVTPKVSIASNGKNDAWPTKTLGSPKVKPPNSDVRATGFNPKANKLLATMKPKNDTEGLYQKQLGSSATSTTNNVIDRKPNAIKLPVSEKRHDASDTSCPVNPAAAPANNSKTVIAPKIVIPEQPSTNDSFSKEIAVLQHSCRSIKAARYFWETKQASVAQTTGKPQQTPRKTQDNVKDQNSTAIEQPPEDQAMPDSNSLQYSASNSAAILPEQTEAVIVARDSVSFDFTTESETGWCTENSETDSISLLDDLLTSDEAKITDHYFEDDDASADDNTSSGVTPQQTEIDSSDVPRRVPMGRSFSYHAGSAQSAEKASGSLYDIAMASGLASPNPRQQTPRGHYAPPIVRKLPQSTKSFSHSRPITRKLPQPTKSFYQQRTPGAHDGTSRSHVYPSLYSSAFTVAAEKARKRKDPDAEDEVDPIFQVGAEESESKSFYSFSFRARGRSEDSRHVTRMLSKLRKGMTSGLTRQNPSELQSEGSGSSPSLDNQCNYPSDYDENQAHKRSKGGSVLGGLLKVPRVLQKKSSRHGRGRSAPRSRVSSRSKTHIPVSSLSPSCAIPHSSGRVAASVSIPCDTIPVRPQKTSSDDLYSACGVRLDEESDSGSQYS